MPWRGAVHGRGGRGARGVHAVVLDGLRLALRLGSPLLLDALLVVAVDAVLRVLFVRQHDEGRLVRDDLVFQPDVADDVGVLRLVLQPLVDHVLMHFDLRDGEHALQLRIVLVLFGESHLAGVGLVFAGEACLHGDGRLAMALVAAEHDQLLAAVELLHAVLRHIVCLDAVDGDFHVVDRLARDFGFGEHDLADDVVVVGDGVVETAGDVADRAHQRPVAAVSHEEAEHADVVAGHQFGKRLRIDFACVGHAVGHDDHAGDAVVVELGQGGLQAVVEVGAAAGVDVAEFFDGFLDVFRRGVDEAAGDVFGPAVEHDDAEAVVGVHLLDGLGDAFRERLDLAAAHAAGIVQNEDVVRAVGDGLEVDAGRQDHHERSVFAVAFEGDDFQAAGQVVGEAVVEDEILREAFGQFIGDVGRAVGEIGLFGGDGSLRRAVGGDGPGGTEDDADGRLARGLVVALPEAHGADIVGVAFLQRILVAADARVDGQRLVVGEGDPRRVLRPQIGDFEREILITVLVRDARVVAGVLLLFIDLLRLVLRDDFAVHGLLADLDLAVRQRCGLRDGEGIDRFHDRVVDVLELLVDLRLRIAVVDGDDDVVADDFRRLQA